MHFTLAFLFIVFACRLRLYHSPSDESEESDKEESEKLGYESGSVGMFGAGFGSFSRDVGLPLGITLSADES